MTRTRTILTVGDTEFHLTPALGDQRWIWLSDCESLSVGGNVGRKRYWARCDGVFLGDEFTSPTKAMKRAVRFKELWALRRWAGASPVGRPSAPVEGVMFKEAA